MTKIDWQLVDRVRARQPLVLMINNTVTADIVANAVNFIGASPIMIAAPEEAATMVDQADAICLNMGTLNQGQKTLMTAILDANQHAHRPLVMDPVAVGSSEYRQSWAEWVLNNYRVDCIRGNAGEIAALMHQPWASHGIDSGTGSGDVGALVQVSAQHFDNIVLASGATDYISAGTTTRTLNFTNPHFPQCVGTGDMLSAIVAAFFAVENNCQAATTALAAFTLCGQHCHDQGAASWFTHFNDCLSMMTTKMLTDLIEKSEQDD